LTIEIQGHVTDAADNAPIGNVLVQLWRATGWKTADLLETTSTDGNGFYHLTYTFKHKEDCKLLYLDFEYQGYSGGAYPPLRCMEGIQTVDVKLEKNPW
jgi:5-hydroxyisourate hydrolase-like protein (transthyretin family)